MYSLTFTFEHGGQVHSCHLDRTWTKLVYYSISTFGYGNRAEINI